MAECGEGKAFYNFSVESRFFVGAGLRDLWDFTSLTWALGSESTES